MTVAGVTYFLALFCHFSVGLCKYQSRLHYGQEFLLLRDSGAGVEKPAGILRTGTPIKDRCWEHKLVTWWCSPVVEAAGSLRCMPLSISECPLTLQQNWQYSIKYQVSEWAQKGPCFRVLALRETWLKVHDLQSDVEIEGSGESICLDRDSMVIDKSLEDCAFTWVKSGVEQLSSGRPNQQCEYIVDSCLCLFFCFICQGNSWNFLLHLFILKPAQT